MHFGSFLAWKISIFFKASFINTILFLSCWIKNASLGCSHLPNNETILSSIEVSSPSKSVDYPVSELHQGVTLLSLDDVGPDDAEFLVTCINRIFLEGRKKLWKTFSTNLVIFRNPGKLVRVFLDNTQNSFCISSRPSISICFQNIFICGSFETS